MTSIRKRGTALILTMVALLVVTLMAGAMCQAIVANHRQARRHAQELQAQWLATAGLQRAIEMARQPEYEGETWNASIAEGDTGQVTIRIEPAADGVPRKIVVEAIYPQAEHHRVLIRKQRNLTPDPQPSPDPALRPPGAP